MMVFTGGKIGKGTYVKYFMEDIGRLDYYMRTIKSSGECDVR